MKNLFDNAKSKPSTAAKKTDDKIIVTVKESEIKGFGMKIERLNTLRTEQKESEAELKMIGADVNDIAREKYLELYKGHGENVGMFYIMAESGTKFKVTPADAYKTVNEEKFDELTKKFGEDLCNHDTEYSFNSKVLAKHMDLISDWIMSSDIPDDDKANLLVRKDKFSIKKGTINELSNYGKKMDKVFEAIHPTVQIKF